MIRLNPDNVLQMPEVNGDILALKDRPQTTSGVVCLVCGQVAQPPQEQEYGKGDVASGGKE